MLFNKARVNIDLAIALYSFLHGTDTSPRYVLLRDTLELFKYFFLKEISRNEERSKKQWTRLGSWLDADDVRGHLCIAYSDGDFRRF